MMKTWVLILLTATVLSAQEAIPWGQEFRVNSYTEGDQSYASMTALKNGGFVVCWESNGQDDSWVGIYAQIYSHNGSPVDKEFRISYNELGQSSPSVIGLADGGFVVCWHSTWQDESGDDIYARCFNAEGKPRGGEFRVNIYTEGRQDFPTVAALPDGSFVVCWTSGELDETGQDGFGAGIYAQRFDAAGLPIGNEFRINSLVEGNQWCPAAASLSSGGFVVCWRSLNIPINWNTQIKGQRFGADGKPLGDEFLISSYHHSYWGRPSVSGLPDGGFVVCWDSWEDGDNWTAIYASCYNADGEPVGGMFRANTYMPSDQINPSVATLANGGFVICWDSMFQDGSWTGIYAQRYNADSKPVGGEFRVNSYALYSQYYSSVVSIPGGFVICWHSTQDGDGNGVYGKRFPAEPLRHELRPFKVLKPGYDSIADDCRPLLKWQPASEQPIAYPWELEYTVYYDTLMDFSTAMTKYAGNDTEIKSAPLKAGKTYFLKVLADTDYGSHLWSDVGAFFVSHTATGVEAEVVPGQFAVLSNYPNPFNPSTTIRFELPKVGYVTLKIYDLSGRLVKTLLSGEQTAGAHTVPWDGTDDAGRSVAAGVYFYQLEFTDAIGARQALTQKMSLVK